MKKIGISFIRKGRAGGRGTQGRRKLTSISDTIDLGEAKSWWVVPTLDEFLPGGFEMLAMAAPRAEEFDKPVEHREMCQRPAVTRKK